MSPAILILIGGLIGWGLFTSLGAKRTGQQPRVGCNIQLYKRNDECVHIHHWVIFSLLLIILLALSRLRCHYDPIIINGYFLSIGFCIGAILNGLSYRDSTVFVQPCQNC